MQDTPPLIPKQLALQRIIVYMPAHKTKVYAVRDGPFFLTPHSKQSLTLFPSSFVPLATQTSLWFLTDSKPSPFHSLFPNCPWQAPLSPSGLISAAQGGLPRPLLQMVTHSLLPFRPQ